MTHLCTLIADRTTRILTPAVRDKAAEIIADTLGVAVKVDELSDHAAYDLAFTPQNTQGLDGLAEKVRHALDPLPVDLAMLPSKGRRKKLFLADMDSTMIEQECIDELADQLGIKAHIAAITERAMRGEIDFRTSLARARRHAQGAVGKHHRHSVFRAHHLHAGRQGTVGDHAAAGTRCVLVSGGFTHFTQKVTDILGFSANHANQLMVENGLLTGTVAEPIQGRDAKKAHLESYASELGIGLEETLAIGDGANDLGMIEAAGLGVAFRAKPAVVERADAALQFADLAGALYLQGYRDADIVR
jgi:phosphoserine phosphatase